MIVSSVADPKHVGISCLRRGKVFTGALSPHLHRCIHKTQNPHFFLAAKGWVKEVSQAAEAEATSTPSKGTGSAAAKGKSSTRGHSPQSASRRAYAVLEAAQAAAARQIIQGADVVVCSCIGAGNDAFVRAIGGDQEG